MRGRFSLENSHAQKCGQIFFCQSAEHFLLLPGCPRLTWKKISKYFLTNSVHVFVDESFPGKPATHLKMSQIFSLSFLYD